MKVVHVGNGNTYYSIFRAIEVSMDLEREDGMLDSMLGEIVVDRNILGVSSGGVLVRIVGYTRFSISISYLIFFILNILEP
jgi:hypothetical protein